MIGVTEYSKAFSYWSGFPDELKNVLRELSKRFDIEVWVWFRESLVFIESYYKQCIRNPQVENTRVMAKIYLLPKGYISNGFLNI